MAGGEEAIAAWEAGVQDVVAIGILNSMSSCGLIWH